MKKRITLNTVITFMMGLVFILTPLLLIIIPIIQKKFNILLLPIYLIFLVTGLFIIYNSFIFYKNNIKNIERLTPEEKDTYYKQNTNHSISQDTIFVIFWCIFAGLVGILLLLGSIIEHSIGLGIGGLVCFLIIIIVIWAVKNEK